MNSKVEAFLEKQDKRIQEYKDNTLIDLGLYEKEYSPDGKQSLGYEFYDFSNGERTYYRKIAIKVTDEEWQQILARINYIDKINEQDDIIFNKEQELKKARLITKILPIYDPSHVVTTDQATSDVPKEKSTLALILRIVSWVCCFAYLALYGLEFDNIFSFLYIGFRILIIILVLYSIAGILDYLTEISAILKNGFKVKKTK